MKKTVQAKIKKPSLILRREHIRVLTSDELACVAGGDRPPTGSDACATRSNQAQTC